MADIFLSYSSQDRERITPLIQSLEQQGWSVWWDRRIPPGKTYDQVIEQALDEARCVVVVWSQSSVQSEWVKVEADEGMNRKILVPVLIDEVKIPLAYRRIQAARLIDWQATASHPEFDLLFETISVIVGEPEFDEEVAPTDSPPPAPAFALPVQPTSIHSIPAIRHFDRSGVRKPEPRNDDPVSVEKVRPERGHSLLPKFAGGAKRALLAAGGLVVLIGIVIAIALDWQSGGGGPSQPTSENENRPASPALSTFEFDVVTLDGNGRERERRKGQAKSFAEDLGDGVKLEMVEIPSGEFMMGSPNNEAGHSSHEDLQHRVTIQRFFMSKYEVTQAQWRAVAKLPKVEIEDLNPDPSYFKGTDLPVENVSWYEVREFCRRLARAKGQEYRLPSEAEWEYAARAKTTTPFAFGPTITPEIVNYDGNYPYGSAPRGGRREKTIPVGSLGVANAFGLFAMHGNVREWCEDEWHGGYDGAPTDGSAWTDISASGSDRVFRGGCWSYAAVYCRSAYRNRYSPGYRNVDLGFRLVRVGR